MQSRIKNICKQEEFVPPCQILFSGNVKKLSRKLQVWQQRILTLNTQGDIYIRRINSKAIPSSCQQKNTKLKPPINITETGVATRLGQASDGKWPTKLDLRQSLVLVCGTTKFLFFPSTHAAEALTTQLRILRCRRDSEEKTGVSTELSSRSTRLSWSDDSIWRDEREQLTLLTGHGRKESFSFFSLLEFSDTIRDSISNNSLLTEGDNTQEETNNSNQVSTVPTDEEMCFDFTSGPGYLACKRANHSLVSLPDNQSIAPSTDNVCKSKTESLLPFRPTTQFTLKPILKRSSHWCHSNKSDTLPRVRFNTCPSVRILSVMSINDKQEIETEYDQIVSMFIEKYLVSNQTHKSIIKHRKTSK